MNTYNVSRVSIRRWSALHAAAPLLAATALLLSAVALVTPPPAQAAIPELLYISADRVMTYSSATGLSTTEQEFAPGSFAGEPHRALDGPAWTWREQNPIDGSFVDYWEELSLGSRTSHPMGDPDVYLPRLSPQGDKLLYAEDAPDPMGGTMTNLMMYDANQKTITTIAPLGESGDWAPTGDRFVFVSYPKALADPNGVMLYTSTLAGLQFKVPTATLITPGEVNIYSPRWSPNGSWIAFQRLDFEAGTVEIVLTDPDGTTSQILATLPLETTGRGMGWLPGTAGDRLLVERVVPGGGPFYLETVPGVGPAAPMEPLFHAALSWMPPADFSDVPTDAPNAEAIYDLSAFGVLGGYDDGTFRPGNPVLRAQYAKMITIALAIHDAAWTGWNNPHFPDVPHPATQTESARYPFDFVEEAAAASLVQGYTDGNFRPWQPISRVQLALMISRAGASELTPAGAAATSAFQDLGGLSPEAKNAIALCYENAIISARLLACSAPTNRPGALPKMM